ncbi:MAG: tyrosine-type recombinase/integrase [Chloroflexi bacterium]|nr:tyrosine-type recombinase/integrase [Chloroflexota bacterium]
MFVLYARRAPAYLPLPTSALTPLRRCLGRRRRRHDQGKVARESERSINTAKTEAGKRQAARDHAIIVLLPHTGLRVGELCNLQMDDLDESGRQWQLTVRDGKGGKQRDVPLNTAARHALRAWLDERPKEAGAWLFVGKGGQPLKARGVQEMLERLGQRASVGVTPHTFRHTFAKNLINAGVSLDCALRARVAALLGHSSLNTTRIYITPSQHDLEQAVAQIGE